MAQGAWPFLLWIPLLTILIRECTPSAASLQDPQGLVLPKWAGCLCATALAMVDWACNRPRLGCPAALCCICARPFAAALKHAIVAINLQWGVPHACTQQLLSGPLTTPVKNAPTLLQCVARHISCQPVVLAFTLIRVPLRHRVAFPWVCAPSCNGGSSWVLRFSPIRVRLYSHCRDSASGGGSSALRLPSRRVTTSHPVSPCVQGANASDLAVAAFSASPAGSMPAVLLAKTCAAPTTGNTPARSCVSTPNFTHVRIRDHAYKPKAVKISVGAIEDSNRRTHLAIYI
jgi:hypothetical protein